MENTENGGMGMGPSNAMWGNMNWGNTLEEKINGTWKFALIIGWLLNFLVAVGAVVVAVMKH